MTRHTSISATGLARRAAIGLMALSLLLSGCSAGPAEKAPAPAPTAAPTSDPKEIAAEIAATFPTEAEWLENYESGELCTAEVPGPTTCGNDVQIPGTNSHGSDLRAGVTAVTAQWVHLSIVEWDSEETAQELLRAAREKDTVHTGDFDIPMNEETREVGLRGSGTLVDFERQGWVGYRSYHRAEMTGSDGAAIAPFSTTTVIQMTHGPLAFSVNVDRASAEPGVADAEVNAWLDRVFGPE
ncbi:hypothetical protein [Cryobacterium sp. W22_MBD10_FK3]|uniref:hypothetical protein n=1 Tax=Cryobacterium sp. W22_MBD10_FK3 TaxID=3240273 RepID=UPI003F91AB73